MSGTSLDGLDICLVEFELTEEQWNYQLVSAKTVKYSTAWKRQLEEAQELDGISLSILDRRLGSYFGEEVAKFTKSEKFSPDLIASHGHTIFHQPEKKLSLQIGHGAFLAATCGYPVVSDFRSLDTAYGGEGAPLVPLAERILFPDHKYFLNIGGIANLSIHHKDKNILGFDVCPANQVLNHLSEKFFGKEYDQNGEIARSGSADEELLSQLNQLPFYQKDPPRSLGREFVEAEILPLLRNSKSSASDLLHTFSRHIADQVAISLSTFNKENILTSGGGAYNSFLLDLLKEKGITIEVPSKDIIEYKEALSFAVLGLLRYLEKDNVLASVTGAKKNNCGGSIFLP